MCSMVLKDTITYYTQHDSPVFCTFLDATKAFDRLHYCKLFRLLIQRKLPACILRVLVALYTNNQMCISWNGVISDLFIAENGVKQGAVLSPILFCVYLDDLLILLSKAGVGCYLGSQFVGALAYADDLVIITPSATAMRKLLSICEDYAHQYDIAFNASKSKWMAIVPSNRRQMLSDHISKCSFYMDNNCIENVQSFMHLGHSISALQNDDSDIYKRRCEFIGQVNNLLCYFNKLNSSVRYRLFISYCTSFYGCELWTLFNRNIEDICTSWRKGLRTVWRVPFRTHRYLLPLISNCLPLFDEICKRSLNFIRTCLQSESNLVRNVSRHGVFNSPGSSLLGSNIRFCARRFECTVWDIIHRPIQSVINNYIASSYENDMYHRAQLVVELLYVRDDQLKLDILSKDELEFCLNYLCVS